MSDHPTNRLAKTVLLTNDDGYQARGLAVMRDALIEAGMTVVVVAPDRNHSASGHRITAEGPLTLVRQEAETALTYAYSGSPADCVRVGILSDLLPRPDVVVAGINHGANAGEDVHYSGTVAAAAEAALLGVPAVAASQDGPEPELPFLPLMSPERFVHADYIARLAQWATEIGRPERLVLNVNMPQAATSAAAELCPLGTRSWSAAGMQVTPAGAGTYTVDAWTDQPWMERTSGSDFARLVDGVVTVNALSVYGGLRDAFTQFRDDLESMPRAL